MSHGQQEVVTTKPEDVGRRLDKCLAGHLAGFSRNRMQQLIAQGCVTAEGVTITDPARKVKPRERYTIDIPELKPLNLVAMPVSLCIHYEDKDLLVIDKPAGMAVHPGPGHADDTLVNALLAHCGDSLSGIGGVMRPGIVHRIDKDTSGLLVVAKHDAAHKHLSAQLAARTLKRQYLAVVKGLPKKLQGSIDAPIGRSPLNRKKMAVVANGKPAMTHYKTEKIYKEAALMRCILESGRTHQIRVHLTHIGHPLIGDPVYGRKGKAFDFPRQALHAEVLALIHPQSGKLMEFSSCIPSDMERLLEQLNGA